MKNYKISNKNYWETIPAGEIIGKNAFPGEEFLVHLNASAKILDLGCGNGEMSELLAGRGFNVTAIDTNIEAINLAKSKSTKVNYILGDITKRLPFMDKTFDAIVISFVLVNIMPQSEREKLVCELIRISKKGSIVWVNEGLISDAYTKRYELSKLFMDDAHHDFFVFKDGTSSSTIQTSTELEQALKNEKVARIAHHFSIDELKILFKEYEILYLKELATASPNTKSIIKMAIVVFRLI